MKLALLYSMMAMLLATIALGCKSSKAGLHYCGESGALKKGEYKTGVLYVCDLNMGSAIAGWPSYSLKKVQVCKYGCVDAGAGKSDYCRTLGFSERKE